LGLELLNRFDLSTFTCHLPRTVSWSPLGTLVITALDRVYETDFFEVDLDGRLASFLPRRDAIGCPTSVQPLADGGFLVADEFGQLVSELRPDGSVAWQYGSRRDPSSAPGKLSNPMGARRLSDGTHLIADTRNHRVLTVGAEGPGTPLDLGFDVCNPTFANRDEEGRLLLCDAGNERALVVDPDGRIAWQVGRTVARRRSLSFPRSVEQLEDGSLLVADTCHDRVVQITPDTETEWKISTPVPIFWPRCARVTAEGTLLVADGRQGRILEVARDGEVLRELTALAGENPRALDDPHEVRALPGSRLLVVDPGQDIVVECDWHGTVFWEANAERCGLRDPHSGQKLADGRVLIADTGNGRLVWIGPDGKIQQVLESARSTDGVLRLDRPRYAEQGEDGVVLIVDSGNNRVLAVTEDGRLVWLLDEIPGSRLPRLSQPRWAQRLGADELLVSDHFQHRIVHLRRERAP
jgi:hypothetical protein